MDNKKVINKTKWAIKMYIETLKWYILCNLWNSTCQKSANECIQAYICLGWDWFETVENSTSSIWANFAVFLMYDSLAVNTHALRYINEFQHNEMNNWDMKEAVEMIYSWGKHMFVKCIVAIIKLKF